MKRLKWHVLWAIFACLAVCLPTVSTLAPQTPAADVQALVDFGARVPGTPASLAARNYLQQEYRQAGYVTELQPFRYSQFRDSGSTLTVGEMSLVGNALRGSPGHQVSAPLVAVPGVGTVEDFATVDVEGAIAIVRRGTIPFLEKARHASAAGALGLAIVNTSPDRLFGLLGGEVDIPVLGLPGESGEPLLEKAWTEELFASLDVDARRQTVTGYNLIAHLPKVDRPDLLLGAHYDSVADSPGANDNASGTAVVLELARRFADTSLASRAWFVAFDGEEDGLKGSKAFVNTAQPSFLDNLQGMFNFDMVGVNERLLVGGTESLVALTQKAAPEVSAIANVGGSDHQSFANAGVPVLFFYRGRDPNYHTPNDTAIDPQYLEATTQVAQLVVEDWLK